MSQELLYVRLHYKGENWITFRCPVSFLMRRRHPRTHYYLKSTRTHITRSSVFDTLFWQAVGKKINFLTYTNHSSVPSSSSSSSSWKRENSSEGEKDRERDQVQGTDEEWASEGVLLFHTQKTRGPLWCWYLRAERRRLTNNLALTTGMWWLITIISPAVPHSSCYMKSLHPLC